MLNKRNFGILSIILGILLIVGSFYIKSRVEEGRKQISQAESKISQGKQLFSLNPITKEVGKEMAASAEIKISDATQKANRYETIALLCQIGGVLFVIVGGGLIFLGRKK
jgi:hypothetical protein